jgi:hypothetical protein
MVRDYRTGRLALHLFGLAALKYIWSAKISIKLI